MTGAWPWVNNKRRRALTLLELLLVMALLAVLAAFSWPLLQRPLESVRLRRAADLVRAEWSAARVGAMTSGQIHAFRFESESDRFAVAPWGDLAVEVSDVAAATDDEGVRRKAAQLPEGIVFVSSDQSPGGSDEQAGAMSNFASDTSVGSEADFSSSAAILFYPDGTTSDVTLRLRNDSQSTVDILLRGLTGVARVGDISYSDKSSQ